MSQFDTPTEAALARFKSEGLSSSPVDGVVEQFAVRFGFSMNTLRHWEQGKARSRRAGASVSDGD
jgi:transcriptional regulator with XRE-family HTH domain